MILLCNMCVPPFKEWKYGNKGVLAIAKWYPAGGFIGGDNGAYYFNPDYKEWAIRIQIFFNEHQHRELASSHYKAGTGQENPVRLEYEIIGPPILPS